MKRKLMFLIVLVMLAVSSVSMASAGVVGWDRANTSMTRWDAYGHVLWQSEDVTHDAYQMEVGPDDYIYLAMWVDDRVAKIDPVTGNRVSELALQQVSITDRTWDLTFGNDIDGDGIDDLWVAAGHNGAGDGYILAYGSASGYAGSSEQVWVIADVDRRTVALDFGPDVSGDDIADLWIVDGDGNDSGNKLVVVNGETGATLYSWPLPNLRAPKDVEVVGDRVYVTSSAAHDVYSYALDGTDEIRVVEGSDSPEYYIRQMQPGLDGMWLTGNRFSGDWGGQQGGITVFDGDWSNGSTYYTLSGSDFSGVVSFPGGSYVPVPVNGEKVSTETDMASWVNPEPNDVSGVITCDVYFTDYYPEYGVPSTDPNNMVDDPNFLNYATKVIDDQATNTLDLSAATTLPLTYGQTFYWRVDTRDSSAPEAGTQVGRVWIFTADNAPPVVDAGQTVYTWLTDGTVDVTMAPTVTDDGKPEPPSLSYLWEEVPEDAAVTINTPTAEEASVTITATGSYMLRLTVDDGELSNSGNVTINVYDDACAAAKGVPGYIAFTGDLDDDCDVDLDDFAVLAADWLGSTALTAPLP